MKVLVTGATGFIGGALTRRLATDGTPVRALVRSLERGARLADWGAELHRGDLLDADSLRGAVQGCSHIVHAAAWVGAGGDAAAIEAVNVGGTEALVNAAAEAEVERFVHISSTGVYGSPRAHGVDEDHPRRRTGQPYHDSKIASEDAVRARAELSTLLLRPSHVFGPGSTHFTVRPLRMLQRPPVPLVAGGQYRFKPVWIDNLLDAIVLGLSAELPSGTALNITDGYTRSWRELFDGYAGAAGQVPAYRSIPRPLAMALGTVADGWCAVFGGKAPISREAVQVLSSDNSYANDRAVDLLDWTPRVDWHEALRLTAAWIESVGGPARFAAPSPSSPLEWM